ncbi:Stage II sporulation protein M [anaerobic digester metagenome]
MFDRLLSRSVIFSTVLFVLAVLGGVLAVRQDPSFGHDLLSGFRDQVALQVLSDHPIVLFVKIFANNLVACVALFIGGATFGVLPLLVLASNGLVIGGIVEMVRQEKGTGFIIASILPHGILEIPAFLISAGLGLLLAEALIRELLHDEGDAAGEALEHGRIFARYVVPFLIVAAAVEAFITPHIIQLIS